MTRFLLGLISLMCVNAFAVNNDVASKPPLLPQPKTSVVPLNRVLVTVNSAPITQHEFEVFYNRSIKRIQMMGQSVPSDSGKFRQYILKQYILRILQLQLAESYGITVTPKEVSKQLQLIAKQNKMTILQLKQKVQTEKYTYPEFRKEVKDEIIIEKLRHQAVGSSINVNDDEIQARYNELKQSPKFQKQYHVIDILTPLGDQPTKAQIAAALSTSKRIAQQFKDTMKTKDKNKTDLGWRALSDLPDLFASAVKTSKVNDVVGPLRAANGFHVLKLAGVKDSSALLPSKQQVAQEVYFNKMQTKLNEWLKTIYSQADIKIVHPV